jgi:hypothetical protein
MIVFSEEQNTRLKIPKGVIRSRQQTMVHKILDRKIKIGQQVSH